ncbi:MAG: SRPBCC family protein [Oscillatoriophycideae cyanobacterium NC_groundwater_1537_Pr4_S-0.65um_50_18]|nr:SRPBCC family protein [Oscillatoriophycideae cyanobacterium NC_groundwater_1537_Pr4_S-0.65um_50_18]
MNTELNQWTTEGEGAEIDDGLAAAFGLPESLSESAQGVEVQTVCAEGRQRQICAKIQIPYSIEQVWQILTDYDRLADFIPNLTKSCKIAHPQGGIRIEQVGTQSLLKLKFCARVVLDMVEQFPHQIDFCMIEGDFKQFSGSWTLQPVAALGAVETRAEAWTELCYMIVVLPPRTMPIGMIEKRLKSGLVTNLSAIRDRADMLFGCTAAE